MKPDTYYAKNRDRLLKQAADHYQNNRVEIEKKRKLSGNKHRQRKMNITDIQRFLWDFRLSHPCSCGEKVPACLHFHHRDPAQKTMEVTLMAKRGYSLARVKEEAAKCDVLCANCHIKHHQGDHLEFRRGKAA